MMCRKAKSEAPLLKLNFLSHGTLESRDLELSRKFYEECLGLEVVRTNISLLIKLGGDNTIAVVQSPKKEKMPILNHNGLDVESQEEVNVAHELLARHKDRWGVTQITKPALQHGTYSFSSAISTIIGGRYSPTHAEGMPGSSRRATRKGGVIWINHLIVRA